MAAVHARRAGKPNNPFLQATLKKNPNIISEQRYRYENKNNHLQKHGIGLSIFYFEKCLCTTYIVIISIH